MNRGVTCFLLASFAFGRLTAQDAGAPRPQDDPKFLKKAAFQIDQLIAGFYRAKKLEVPRVADDATFLRRAFLVSIGRIPTTEEALPFLEIEDASKRDALVDYLVKSKGVSEPHDELGLRPAPHHGWACRHLGEQRAVPELGAHGDGQ